MALLVLVAELLQLGLGALGGRRGGGCVVLRGHGHRGEEEEEQNNCIHPCLELFFFLVRLTGSESVSSSLSGNCVVCLSFFFNDFGSVFSSPLLVWKN